MTLRFIAKYKINLILLALSLCLISPGLWVLEFFRHTEADRVLIATEMVKRNDFIVPHLLGTPIFTKPPLFYWLLASGFSLFSSNSETISRLPSAILAIALVQFLFISLKKNGLAVEQALISSIILLTSPLFLQLASRAEIDLTFSALTSVALLVLFQSYQSNKPIVVCLSYFFCGLATLTKGPVAIGIVFLVDFFWLIINWKLINLRRFIYSRVLALGILLAVVAVWLYPILIQVNSDHLFRILQSEVTRRFDSVSSRESKGYFFYVEVILLGCFPWSAIAIFSCIKFRSSVSKLLEAPIHKFSLLCCSLILLVLTLAHGKASRYLLPACPFIAVVFSTFIGKLIFDYKPKIDIRKFSFWVSGVLFIIAASSSLYFSNQTISIFFSCIIFLLAIYLIQRNINSIFPSSLAALMLLTIFIRFGETVCYSHYRNQTKSVVDDVNQIASLVASTKQIYALEFIERWYAYYLDRFGIAVTILHPDSVNRLMPNEEIFLILSKKDELWRVAQLTKTDPKTKLIPTKENSQVLLVSTSKSALIAANLQSDFPTDLTRLE